MALEATAYCEQSDGRACPACNSVAGLSKGEKNGFQILSCRKCGTLYTSRLPDLLNGVNYDSYYEPQHFFVPEFMHERTDDIVSKFSVYRQTNRFLEIGFGAGTLLQAAARAGWDVEGVEISQTAIRNAKERGFRVFCGELQQAQYPAHYFDVVVASEVLEHVPDPQSLVREVARVLRPRGLFWATTPHGKGIAARLIGLKWLDICPPHHLQLFSLRGVQIVFLNAGFRRIKVLTQGANPGDVWRTLWRGAATRGADGASTDEEIRDRRPTENWTKSFPRRAVKRAANIVLGITRLGDSLRIRAEK
jgi:2-polyprenyl-3-methyl-5-hydroxy-6-metoxy-1,4-benzoquinol methylase